MSLIRSLGKVPFSPTPFNDLHEMRHVYHKNLLSSLHLALSFEKL